MTDYISREDTIKTLNDHLDKTRMVNNTIEEMVRRDEIMVCRGIIRDVPSADVVEQKTGKWIRPTRVPDSMLVECSLCGFDTGAFSFNFCPNCGARMVNDDV